MERNDRYLTDELLRDAAAAALDDAFAEDALPDAAGIDALLDLLEANEDTALPDDETLERQKQQTLRALRRKRRFSPRRMIAAAAALVILAVAAVLGVLQQSGKIDVLPFGGPTNAQQSAVLQVGELLDSLQDHAFQNVALSQVFLEDNWVATTPTYYREGAKSCVDFRVYNADCCYCFSLKKGEESTEDYASLGAERVVTIEKSVVIYVFGSGADLSEMRYQVDGLSYNVTANVPTQTMIDTANQIEHT